MSKASEWAREMAAHDAEIERLQAIISQREREMPQSLEFRLPHDNGVRKDASTVIAWVRHSGHLVLSKNHWLTEPEALALARWINDTFGEPPAAVPHTPPMAQP